MPASSQDTMVTSPTVDSAAMRAASTAVRASFDEMSLCTRGGTPIVRNDGYDELALSVGSRTIADLALRAIAHAGDPITIARPEGIRCQATQIDVATHVTIYVVAFRREDDAQEQSLSRAAVREVQQNLRQALQLLSDVSADDRAAGPLTPLTVKEDEVLGALMAGYRVPTIARDFHVSQSTVRSHLRSIFQKYDVHSQAALFEKLLADNS